MIKSTEENHGGGDEENNHQPTVQVDHCTAADLGLTGEMARLSPRQSEMERDRQGGRQGNVAIVLYKYFNLKVTSSLTSILAIKFKKNIFHKTLEMTVNRKGTVGCQGGGI